MSSSYVQCEINCRKYNFKFAVSYFDLYVVNINNALSGFDIR